MSPFRRILAERGVRHPAAYSVAIVMAGCLMSGVGGAYFSIQASNRSIARIQQAEEQRRADEARVAAENKAASCAFITTIAKAYEKDPPNPPTDTYRTISQAWATLAKRCQ